MEEPSKVFSNDEITVTYSPISCIRADKCVKELSEVFRLSVIPWIDLDGCDNTERIIQQIKRCPSGALQYKLKKQQKNNRKEKKKIAS